MVQVVLRVLVAVWLLLRRSESTTATYVDLQRVVRPVVLVVVVDGQFIWDLLAEADCGLVGPAARHVLYGVPAAAKHEHGDVELLCVLEAAAVALDREVEGAKAVPGERVRTALHDNRLRLEAVHHLVGDLQARASRCLPS